jgi:aryl-alcohol dehydrogenase-like predicted oxidoreductase
MRYLLLGQTGLRVAELCLGTMVFGAAAARPEARRIFERYAEQGGNFLDTAVNYAGGASEELIGELLDGQRDRFVIATKYTAPLRREDPNSGGNHAKSIRQAIELSLRRLKTDYIDLYWVHLWDQVTPLDELVGLLDDAIRAGKVLHVGISNTPAWAVAHAHTIAKATSRAGFAAIQVEYNLTERTTERELLPMAQQLGLSTLAWGPLAGGLLSGKYGPGTARSTRHRLAPGDRRLTENNRAIAAEVVSIARELGTKPAAVALAWLRSRPSTPLPIIGARSTAQLDQAMLCLDLTLPRAALDRLDEISAISLGYPHDFVARMRATYAA